ncbi:small nuclear ribonucleoprotein B and B' [Ceratocystis lukuohia]|uniref:Sm protein B n=2 Tax=Ceratocystis TaxID=5157 RepID=A0A0F8BY66_CERFI|nr:Small nuclear ribonucleoprotein-associated protein B [Ceratocystis platani]
MRLFLSSLLQINWRMRVTLNDGRQMTGQMLAFDKHMNLVLADTEEFRRYKHKNEGANNTVETEEKRTLGLIILRGAQIISLSVESPPPADASARLGKTASGLTTTLAAGPGVARPAGRGAPMAPSNLAGPAPGVGGAAPPPGLPSFPPAPGFAGRGAHPPGFHAGFPAPPNFPGVPPFSGAPPGFTGGAPSRFDPSARR